MSSPNRNEKLAAAGHWLRREREKHGYAKAVDFAKKLGIDRSLVSNYERGASEVSDDRAEQIAEALGLPILEVRRGLRLWVPDEGSASGGITWAGSASGHAPDSERRVGADDRRRNEIAAARKRIDSAQLGDDEKAYRHRIVDRAEVLRGTYSETLSDAVRDLPVTTVASE